MIIGITAAAEADPEAIGDCIARDNPTRPAGFVRELYQLCLELGEMPKAWPVVPRYEHHGIRRRVHGRYLIFYRMDVGRIMVLHSLNGTMDFETILFSNG